MSIVDFIAVVSFGLTCFGLDIPLARIIISHKNSRPVNRPPEVRPKNLTIGGRFSYGKI